jgi:electron transport complex protein RnfD
MIYDTLVALIPAVFAGWYFFGWAAIQIIFICVITAVATETLWQKLTGRALTVKDGSAAVTGILFGLILSPMDPWWLAVLGTFVAIVVGKHLFGGLGNHPFSAVLVGWTFIQISYRELMQDFPFPAPKFLLEPGKYLAYPPLQTLWEEDVEGIIDVPWMDFFVGNVPGSIGTVSVLAILIGGAYLLYRRIITWHIPVSFIFSVWIFAFIMWRIDPAVYANPTFHVLSGWVMIGAFFLSTEKGTSPVTVFGMIAYGIGCGVLTMIIRIWGLYLEGVPFAILLMNAATPLLDRIRPRVVGRVEEIA